MTLRSGARVGPYDVLGLIGTGGMGEVYRARDTRLNRFVAIKFAAERFTERFEREAQAVAALNHPHICTLYDVGPDYLVMELVDGQPLAGPLPLERALMLARQILSALAEAHDKGITHRDLKPANILVTAQGVKLLDFGLAKLGKELQAAAIGEGPTLLESATVAQPLTGVHTILGTPHYMSPEQAVGQPADARSDLFSFGLVFYEMLTGRRAFDGANTASVIAAILERDAPSIAAVAPPALDRILQTCLAKNPFERWQSARDIDHALDLVQGTSSAEIASRRRWPTLVAASLAGFVAASAIGVAVYASRRAPVVESRRLSFQLAPPPGAEFQSSTNGGGSAISPDGRSIAFVAVIDGTPRLWIRTLDTLAARELPGTDGAKLPFWSPDSRSLGFFTSTDLRKIDVDAGASTVLAPARDARGGTWNADGTIVFSPGSLGPLYRVSASGGKAVPLTKLSSGEISHRWPQFLPDGRTVQYTGQGRASAIFVTTLDRPDEVRRVLDAQFQAVYFAPPAARQGYFLWSVRDMVVAQRFDPATSKLTGSSVPLPGTEDVSSFSGTGRVSMTVSTDGTLLYNTGGTRFQLAWFTPDGKQLGTVGAVDQYIGLRLSPDASEALVTIRDPAVRGDLYRVDLATGNRTRSTSDSTGWYGVWSPDAKQIAYSGPSGLNPQMASIRTGGGPHPLSNVNPPVFPSDWSRDGQSLVYTETSPDTSNDIWLLPLAGGGKPRPLVQTSSTELQGQLSPDGQWLAFTSNESLRDDVYVQNVSDASTRQLVSSTGGGGSYPRWGSAGHELWYRASNGRLMRVPVRIAGASIELGTPTAVLRLADPPAVHVYSYDVAPDGRILALTPPAGGSQQLTVLMNWQTALQP